MVKQTQTIYQQQPKSCFSVFDRFVKAYIQVTMTETIFCQTVTLLF